MSFISKSDYMDLFLRYAAPLTKHIRDGGLYIGEQAAVYKESTARTEGFLRVLWGLVPFIAGGGECDKLLKLYNKGFHEGTDKTSPAYWGDCTDFDQLFVEMAPIAYAILFAPESFLSPLPADAKNRLADWLYQINSHDIPVNNWQFFRVLVNLALKKAGMKYSEEKLNDALGNIEEMYIGNGWYTDGHTHRCDYYISFAIHFYSLIYALVMRDEDKERSKEFINRAERFGKDFIYWFSENSEAVPYGRSLTYRFAQISFWSACLISGAKPFDYGVIKGIISRHMSDWAAAPICDNSGILTTGYKYPNMHMTEWYNASGSPYWAFKAFAILMLPDNHLFWKVDPKPMPELEGIKFIPEARMLITRTESSVCMFVPGLQDDENFGYSEWKYSKFAYSTAFGFSVPRGTSSLAAAAPDSMLAFELGGSVFVKNLIRECRISDSAIFMKWSPFPGIDVETTVKPFEDGYERMHIIKSDYICTTADCGFAVKYEEAAQTVTDNNSIAYGGGMWCSIRSNKGQAIIIHSAPNTNLINNKTVIPAIRFKIEKGITQIKTITEYGEYSNKDKKQ